MGLKQGEIKVTGKWKQDRARARQQVYRVSTGSGEITKVGEAVAAAAKQNAATAAKSKSVLRGDVDLVAGQIRFKDIRQFTTKQNTNVSKRGDQILVGLVISDNFLSMALEFGAQTSKGFLSPSGFMRAAALKVAKRGYRFAPPKPAEQQKAIQQGQRLADRYAKKVSARNRRNARSGRPKRRGRRRR